jgi:hypothetical protein
LLVLIGCIGLNAVGAIPSFAAKNDACRVGCRTEKQACREAYKSAFQTTKSDCTGSGKAKRQCVKTARTVLRAAVKKCRGFAATCVDCCKAGGTNCNVQCGDGVVSGGESCDPPYTGEPMTVGFNARYLLDVLGVHASGDSIELGLTDEVGPGVAPKARLPTATAPMRNVPAAAPAPSKTFSSGAARPRSGTGARPRNSAAT